MNRNRNRNRQGARASGGGGGAPASESELVTNAGLILWMNPTEDTLYQTDAETTPVVKTNDGENVMRYYPAVKPADLTYFSDTSLPPTFRNAENGINSNAVIDFDAPQEAYIDVGASFTHDDVIDADAALLVFCGRLVAVSGTDNTVIVGDPDNTQGFVIQTQSAGSLTFRLHNGGPTDVSITKDGSNLFSGVMWLHGGNVDWWLNGTKQTQITSVANITSVIDAACVIRQGNTGNDFQLLRLGVGTGAGAQEADIVALVNHLESLLGRA